MSYKNTVKLFTSNFALVWKQLLYLLICGVLFAVFAYTTGKPIINLLSQNGVFTEFKIIIETVYQTPSEFALKFSELFRHILNVIFLENFGTIWLSFFALIILCIFIPYVLVQMSYYNISSLLYKKLSMNMNVGYINNGLKCFLPSLFYALTNILLSLPFFALSIVFIAIYLTIANTIVSSIVGMVILSLLLILLKSIKFSMFTCYTGYMVENAGSPFVAFGKGFVMFGKKFWRIFSTSIIVTLTIIIINGFIGLFTFLAGLIVSIPATFVFLAIYYTVVYFNTKGERYYLGTNLIYNPTIYTIKQDEVSIIEVPEKPAAGLANEQKEKKVNKTKKTKSKNISNKE